MEASQPDPDVVHIVGRFQHLLDWLGIKVPVALCGFRLAGRADGTDPGPGAPVCPDCAGIAAGQVAGRG